MEIDLKDKIETVEERASTFCEENGIEVVFTHEMSTEQMKEISKRTEKYPNMYNASLQTLENRLKNGCFLLMKDEQILGHIFAHKHVVDKYAVFERSSLWVHPDYRTHNLGFLLMHNLTAKYTSDFVISIAQEPRVHHNNELLGMKRIPLSELSPVLIEALEKLGKLRDEVKYRYYVNPHFEKKIHQFNKILNNQKNKNLS